MGLRSLNIPANAQPQDLPNPIPGQGDRLEDVLKDFRPPQQASVGASAQPTLEQTIPSFNPQPARAPATAPAKPNDGLSDEQRAAEEALLQEMAGSAPKPDQDVSAARSAEEGLIAALKGGLGSSETNDLSPLEQIKTQGFMGVGRNDTERFNALKSIFGPNNARKNKDGSFSFRRAGNKAWQPVEEDSGLKAFLGDLASYAAPAAQVGLEAGVGAATVAGTSLTGPAAAGLAAVAAPAAGVAARSAAVQGLGIEDPNYSEAKEFGMNAAFNVATLGLGEVGGAIFSKFKQIGGDSQLQRLQKLALVRKSLDDIRDEARLVMSKSMPGVPSVAGEVAPAQVGQFASSAVDRYHERLGNAVAVVKEKALQLAGDQRFPVDGMLENMQKIITREGGTIDPTTGLFYPVKSSNRTLTETAIRAGDDGAVETLAQGATSQSAFGHSNGKQLLSDLIEDYNAFAAQQRVNGGSSMKELLDRTSKYQKAASYGDFIKNNEMNTAIQDVGKAAAMDRNRAFEQVLAGTAEEKTWKASFKAFSNDIDRIEGFKKSILDKESGEMIAEAIFQPGNAQRLKDTKALLGADSEEWRLLRGRFIADKMEQAIDPATGIFDGAAFIRSTSPQKLGKDFLNELGDVETLNRLRAVSKFSQSISTTDLITPKAEGDLMRLVGTVVGAVRNPMLAARYGFRMTGGNLQAVNYLLDEGYLKLAREATSKKAEQEILEALRLTQKMVDNSIVASKDGVKRYIIRPSGERGSAAKAVATGAATAATAAYTQSRGGFQPLRQSPELDQAALDERAQAEAAAGIGQEGSEIAQ